MTNYWLCIATKANYEIGRSGCVWGLEARFRKTYDRVNVNDVLVFYLKGRQLGGAFRVVSKNSDERGPRFPGGKYPLRMGIESIRVPPSGIAEWDDAVIKNLSIFRQKDHRWKFYLWGQALVELTKRDFDYLISRMS
jgi:predicted RNA-binding protein